MTSRTEFNESWLTEMPQMIGKSGNLLPALSKHIQEWINFGSSVVKLGDGFCKIEGEQTVFYWHEHDSVIDIAAEFTKKPQTLTVNAVGRSKLSLVHASDLYSIVLHDQKSIAGNISAIRLMSDSMLSDDGINLWKRLLSQGHRMFAYDKNSPKDFSPIRTEEDLDAFVGASSNFSKYQFVITESQHLIEVQSQFMTRCMRELSGLGTSD